MDYLNLKSELLCDTILVVKKDNIKNPNSTVWINYIVPILRKDGTKRTYGDLYFYWSNLEGFRFAKGYVRQVSECGEFWTYKHQYLYFSKEEPPQMDTRELKENRFISK